MDELRMWSRGKHWPARALLLVYLAYLLSEHLKDPQYGGLFGGINLGVHELGHVVFSWGGEFMMVAGGTILELSAPIAAGVIFARQRDYFAIAVAGAWLAFAMLHVAVYVGDARSMELSLVGLGADPIHDWEYLLTALGVLEQDTVIAGILAAAASLLGMLSIAFGAWLCFLMATLSPTLGADSGPDAASDTSVDADRSGRP